MEIAPQQIEKPEDSFVRIAAVNPELTLGDINENVSAIYDSYWAAVDQGAELVAYPELSLTGYTMGDLFHQKSVTDKVHSALSELAQHTKNNPPMIIGAPLLYRDKLYNTGVVLADGEVKGVIPKSYLPNYNEFYEKRWFESGIDIKDKTIRIGDEEVPFGTDIIFGNRKFNFGVEICEDLWAPKSPSVEQAQNGAHIGVNLSASNELVGKAAYRRNLVAMQAAKLLMGYVYVSSGVRESVADTVFGGHTLIAENGRILAENQRFSEDETITIADIDIDHIKHDRQVNTSFEIEDGMTIITLGDNYEARESLERSVNPHPFVPGNTEKMNEVATEILNIQAHALAQRTNGKLIIGLSGGLDSTLALLVAKRAMDIKGLGYENIYTVTMPGPGSSNRTQDNATLLAEALGTTHQIIPIAESVEVKLRQLGHEEHGQDVTFENVQARDRTDILMNMANKVGGRVVGTGDMSEIALGWCTYNADQQSMYNPNAGVPKTLIKYLVNWTAQQPDMTDLRDVLEDILDTPISPELVMSEEALDQQTEEIIGPYELHDFFLYYVKRFGDTPAKIAYLAKTAFEDKYDDQEINKWLSVFLQRFTNNQFKRENVPNGPKVGTVSLSPRADHRMPPNASHAWYS